MTSNKKIIVSPSPHVHGKENVYSLMNGVLLALMPAMAISVYFFGWGSVIITATAVLSCLVFEYLIQRFIMKTPVTIQDGSAAVTGVLLAFCLPANLPIPLVILGSFVAIGVGKLTFGGLGKNPFNPALVGRVFLFISFPSQMATWPLAKGFSASYTDAETGATPLAILKEGLNNNNTVPDIMEKVPSHADLFFGNMGGSAGEIAAFALLLGLLFMLIRKIITWHIPVSIIGTVFIFTGILWMADPTQYASPVFHLLTGGLMLGAIFMATDYVTSPMTGKGMIIYGVGIGVITVVIRIFGSYPEGIQFAILTMNAFTPLINHYIKPRQFGKIKNK
jgi:Na+-translocating ferredoxin:NAD+ oxidoreductase subunit D